MTRQGFYKALPQIIASSHLLEISAAKPNQKGGQR
jgi:hypothetical protein